MPRVNYAPGHHSWAHPRGIASSLPVDRPTIPFAAGLPACLRLLSRSPWRHLGRYPAVLSRSSRSFLMAE